MAVALDDLVLSVELADHGARNQAADLSAEAHGAAQVRLLAALLDIALLVGPLGDEGDDWILGVLLELSRVGARHAGLVASKLNDGALHAEADAEIGNAVLPRVLGGEDLAFNAARAEAARNQDCVEILELVGSVVLECLGVNVADLDLNLVVDACVLEGLVDRLVGIRQGDILPDHAHGDLAVRVGLAVDNLLPVGEISLPALDAEPVADQLIKPL